MTKKTKDKIQRPRALPAKGFRDYFGRAVSDRNAMLAKIGAIYHRYGFAPLESSAVETVEALGKFLPDVDRPNAGVFAWQDEDDGWLALRYDLTAPLARVFAQHRNELPLPYRRYAMGAVWRNEKTGAGRFRQFYQCDADTVGASQPAADAEICAMLADVLEGVGITRGDYIIRVNSRKILNGVLDSLGVDDTKTRDGVLRTIDKFDKLGEAGVRALLGEGRKDDSGAFIDGVGLTAKQSDAVLDFLLAKRDSTEATLFNLEKLIGDSAAGQEGIVELREIMRQVRAQGYGREQIVLDPAVVRGLGYYTGAVYEAELTFEIKDERGRVRQFGSVAGGGRYDDLIKRFTNQAIAATGVSVGVDRLLAALEERARQNGIAPSAEPGPVIVTVMDKDNIAGYQAMVAELRAADIRAELYLGNPRNFGNQLKYADMRGSPAAIIQGEDERASDTVQIKDLALGAELSKGIEDSDEWRSQPAQTLVKRAELVAAVRKIVSDPVIVIVMDKERIADYQAMVSDIRKKDVRAELYFRNQFVDMHGSPLAIVQGEDERARGKVQIRNLTLVANLPKNIDDFEEWLKQPLQITIARGHLAGRVKRFIDTGSLAKLTKKDAPQ